MEKYKEIERSIIKKYRKDIFSKFIKAVSEYELIKENDNVMVWWKRFIFTSKMYSGINSSW